MNLQNDFISQTIHLVPDYEGEVTATLIASKFNIGNRRSILYLHGYIDYFYQVHMCEKFIENNFDFYALDLRKYGRSLMPHQHPNYCKNVEEYFEEISYAIERINETSNGQVYLLGHSTGGLIASNYMNSGEARSLVKALVLNSPFFDFNKSGIEKALLPLVAKVYSFVSPYAKVERALSSVWPKAIHKDYQGEWDFDLKWKPIEGFPTYFKWVAAISKAQKLLHSSNISVPILVMHASKSGKPSDVSKNGLQADIVLNIQDMKKVGAKLGPLVTFLSVDNGFHDLFLSPKPVREEAFRAMFDWLNAN